MGLDFQNDLTKAQYAAVTHRKGPAMVASTAGSGKCVTADTLIPTSKGLIYIDNIPNHFKVGKYGECSATVAGAKKKKGVSRKKTSHWFNMGSAPIIEVYTDSGLRIKGTYEHPLLILCNDGEIRWRRLSKIKENDIVVASLGAELWGTHEMDPDLAYVLGLLIGDGTLSLKGGTFGLCRNDDQMAAVFHTILAKRYNYYNVQKYRKKGTNSVTHSVGCIKAKKDLQLNLDVPMVRSPFRYVPSSILQGNRETVLHFLQGLFDTEASVHSATFEYTTASERLGREVQLLLFNLGVRAVLREKKVKAYPDNTYYRISVTGVALRVLAELKPFRFSSHKKARLSKIVKKPTNPNKDLVLNQQDRIKRLRDNYFTGQSFWLGKTGALKEKTPEGIKQFGLKRYIAGERNPSKNAVRRILEFVPSDDSDAKWLTTAITNYMFDPVVKVIRKRKKEKIFDFTVPSGSSFVGNGVINHNTRCITYRIAYLLDGGDVDPYEILAITFTNKAASEMKERVATMVPRSMAKHVWISTFHSMCARMLRTNSRGFDVHRNYSIADADDSKSYLVEAAVKVTKLPKKIIKADRDQYGPGVMQSHVSGYKNSLIQASDLDPEEEVELYQKQIVQIYKQYEKLLKRANSLDFDDLLLRVALGLQKNKELREGYADMFRHVLVDEYQDTNVAQYKIMALLTSKRKNPYVVGDDDQCVPGSEEVRTPKGGPKQIRFIREGDEVLSGGGYGTQQVGIVERVFKRFYKGEVIRVTTKLGLTFRTTPEHCIFGRPTSEHKCEYVYLMYREDRGFRIGRCGHYRKGDRGQDIVGFIQRLRQERGDRIWVIRTCESLDEAAMWEAIYSAQYGIPTVCFHSSGRRLVIEEEHIEFIYQEIPTWKRGLRILRDHYLSFDHPHYISDNSASKTKHITLRMFGNNPGSTAKDSSYFQHEFSLEFSEPDVRRIFGKDAKKAKRSKDGQERWRVRHMSASYSKCLHNAEKAARKLGGTVIQKARLIAKRQKYHDLMPIGNILVGMRVPITMNGEVVEDAVVKVERENYRGYVYDLSIPTFRNYSVGGVLVHNSIYAFRGADPANIKNFQVDYPDHTLYKLEKNFRSVQPVADVANAVIVNNEQRIEKTIVTVRPGGDKVQCLEFTQPHQEAGYIVEQIRDKVRAGRATYKDFTILYRINARSRPFEEFFRRNNIPYKVIGALGFYQRKVIKDIVAYLRLVNNVDDYASFNRIYNTPTRGIGDSSYQIIIDLARERKCSPLYLIKRGWYKGHLSGRALDGVRSLKKLFKKLREMPKKPVAPLLQIITEESGYRKSLNLTYIKKKSAPNEAERVLNQIELLDEFEHAAVSYDGADQKALAKYLEFIALLQSTDDRSDGNQVLLMSIHASKGLEFSNVYLVGCCEGILPHTRCFEEEGGLEEERRIFFVGTTRAEDSLTFSHFRFIPNRGDFSLSSFLNEAGETINHVNLTHVAAGSLAFSTNRGRTVVDF